MSQICVLEIFYTYISIWEDKVGKIYSQNELDYWETDLKFLLGIWVLDDVDYS